MSVLFCFTLPFIIALLCIGVHTAVCFVLLGCELGGMERHRIPFALFIDFFFELPSIIPLSIQLRWIVEYP